MKTLFMGTPQFAAQVLEYLINRGVHIVGVISKPDKPQGRSKRLVPTPVKLVAQNHALPLFQPDTVSDPLFVPTLASLEPDLIAVVAYGEIVKENVLSLPHRACINLHASLLPKYRGAAPIQWALINGEVATGVTIIHMAQKMDAGDILAQETLAIGEQETCGELQERLCHLGSRLLFNVIKEFETGTPVAHPQNHDDATFAPKITVAGCRIDWSCLACDVANCVRGFNPHPAAWTEVVVRGSCKKLKVFTARPVDAPQKGALVLPCGKGTHLLLESVQLEGKQRMGGAELLRGIGHHLQLSSNALKRSS